MCLHGILFSARPAAVEVGLVMAGVQTWRFISGTQKPLLTVLSMDREQSFSGSVTNAYIAIVNISA